MAGRGVGAGDKASEGCGTVEPRQGGPRHEYPCPSTHGHRDRGRGYGGHGRGRSDHEEHTEAGGRGHGRGRGYGGHDQEPTATDHGKSQVDNKKRTADAGDEPKDTGKKHKEVVSCDICDENHLTSECPIYFGPKPYANFCGYAGEGGFYQVPYDGTVAKVPRKESATALISIKEGNISAELIKSELARLIPVKWTWAPVTHGDGFLVQFPCKVELQRMVATKFVHTSGGEGIMIIEEWNHVIEPSRQLEKVWFNVYGVSYELRHFLPLWRLALLLGPR